MPGPKISINILSIMIVVVCVTKSDTKINDSTTDRMVDCYGLLSRQVGGFYLSYLNGEDTFYTGKCFLKRDNGNGLTYKYLKGHILEIIERYPDGKLCEEIYYDDTSATAGITRRARYYPNGNKSYQQINGNYRYELFYENGRLERKAGFGYTKEDKDNRFYNLYAVRLYDSIWKQDGTFDTVYRYSKGSITY